MFTDSQLKGNWGEQFVAERLSASGCLVRHIPQGHDSGIDLYCETTADGKPFLHFWCQVKVSGDFKPENRSNNYSCSESDLRYWLGQPIPVFLFLVPDERSQQPPIFVCSPLHRNGQTLESLWRLNNLDEIKGFLAQVLPLVTFHWEMSQGRISPLRNPNATYTYVIPTQSAHLYEEQLKTTLRIALWRLGEDILGQYYDFASLTLKTGCSKSEVEAIAEARPYIEALEVLVEGKKIGHYENFVTIGVLAELEGNLPRAEQCYQRAKQGIEGDQNLDRSQEPWKTTCSKVENHLARVRGKIAQERPAELAESGSQG